MKGRYNHNTIVKYLKYARKVMKEHNSEDMFTMKLEEYKLTQIYNGLNSIISTVGKIVHEIIVEKEIINIGNMEDGYLEYLGTLENKGNDYIHISTFKNSKPWMSMIVHSKFSIEIPLHIKLCCLCIGVQINQHIIYD